MEQDADISRAKSNGSCSNDSGDSTAHSIIALLAKELPKLVNAQSASSQTPASLDERASKRKRLDGDEDNDAADGDSAFPRDDMPRLPDPELLTAIVSAYFFHIHPWIPMIHQDRFMQKLADDVHQEQSLLILHAMAVSAAKFVPRARALAQISSRTRKWIICTAMDSLSVQSIQALLIIVFDDIGQGNMAKAWFIIGSLTRSMEYTQLAQEQDDGEHRPFCQSYMSLSRTDDWIEIEERRRVFWNVFLLDRFCSVTMGWNTALTSDNVNRRLPCDGYLWRKQKPVLTPYFGVWDKAIGRIGDPISYVTRSRYASPSQGEEGVEIESQTDNAPTIGPSTGFTADMSAVGALAYNIEATESMSRVMSDFLQQKINLRDQNEIRSWLTLFKELDLRLVHWKMLLPQKRKENPNLSRDAPLMDPNLTVAHVTHNTSMILLHQLIAYPPMHWVFRNWLPSSCSADVCYSAGVEIATITQKYLIRSRTDSPLSSQYAFCLFIAARVLIAHWRYMAGDTLPPEFWSLIQSLEDMSRRWSAYNQPSLEHQDIFAKYATRLRELYKFCTTSVTYQIDLMAFPSDISYDSHFTPMHTSQNQWADALPMPATYEIPTMLSGLSNPVDFNTDPQLMMDQTFMDIDRVIAFEDGSMFAATFDQAPLW